MKNKIKSMKKNLKDKRKKKSFKKSFKKNGGVLLSNILASFSLGSKTKFYLEDQLINQIKDLKVILNKNDILDKELSFLIQVKQSNHSNPFFTKIKQQVYKISELVKEIYKQIEEYKEMNNLQNKIDSKNDNWSDRPEIITALLKFIDIKSNHIFPLSEKEELEKLYDLMEMNK